MPKKLLFITVLLLLVSVQALAAGCNVRCALMGVSADRHASQADERMADCHGMSMEAGQGVSSLTASDSCPANSCGTELSAINKSADQSDADSTKVLVSAVALLDDPFGNDRPNSTATFATLSRRSDSRPLAQRPGSSLRI
jgi:hypothetical protein